MAVLPKKAEAGRPIWRGRPFDDVDVAFTWHPATMNAVATGSNQANIQAAFTFTGQASHAAASPEKGRSALDAVELMNVGVNYLREHMADYERVHYAVLDTGGVSPNVVQEHAEVLYLIRSKSNAEAKRLYKKGTEDCPKGRLL